MLLHSSTSIPMKSVSPPRTPQHCPSTIYKTWGIRPAARLKKQDKDLVKVSAGWLCRRIIPGRCFKHVLFLIHVQEESFLTDVNDLTKMKKTKKMKKMKKMTALHGQSNAEASFASHERRPGLSISIMTVKYNRWWWWWWW